MKTYAQKLERLEELRKLIGNPEIEIDKAIGYYEESISIFKDLKTYLDNAQAKFLELEGNEEDRAK